VHRTVPALTVQVDVDAAQLVQDEVAQHVHALDGVRVGQVGGQEPGVVLLRGGGDQGAPITNKRRGLWPA
jgi:hypothetical protein